MSVTINNSQNTVSLTENKGSLEIIDNNTSITVNIPVEISTIATIASQGPKGDAGIPGEYISGSSPIFSDTIVDGLLTVDNFVISESKTSGVKVSIGEFHIGHFALKGDAYPFLQVTGSGLIISGARNSDGFANMLKIGDVEISDNNNPNTWGFTGPYRGGLHINAPKGIFITSASGVPSIPHSMLYRAMDGKHQFYGSQSLGQDGGGYNAQASVNVQDGKAVAQFSNDYIYLGYDPLDSNSTVTHVRSSTDIRNYFEAGVTSFGISSRVDDASSEARYFTSESFGFRVGGYYEELVYTGQRTPQIGVAYRGEVMLAHGTNNRSSYRLRTTGKGTNLFGDTTINASIPGQAGSEGIIETPGNLNVVGNISSSGHITASGNISSSGNLIASESITLNAAESRINFTNNLTIGNPTENEYIQLIDEQIRLKVNGGEAITINGNSAKVIIGYSGINETTIGSSGNILAQFDSQTGKTLLHSSTEGVCIGAGSLTEISGISDLAVSGSSYFKGSITASGTISSSGNIITEGNIISSGDISASGNVYAGNIILPPEGSITPSISHNSIYFRNKLPGTGTGTQEWMEVGPDKIRLNVNGNPYFSVGPGSIAFNVAHDDVQYSYENVNGVDIQSQKLKGDKNIGYFRDHIAIGSGSNMWPTTNGLQNSSPDGTLKVWGSLNVADGTTTGGLKGDITASGDISSSGLITSNTLIVDGSQVDFTNLPTSDPSVAGRLWNDSNTVKISAG